MKKNLRIATNARVDDFIYKVIQQLGRPISVKENDWREHSDVVVVVCGYPASEIKESDWSDILDSGKTLGLIGLQNQDYVLLQKILGRSLSNSIRNLFIRKSFTGKEPYTFTIVPEPDSNMDPFKCAAFLEKDVFIVETASQPPVDPPPTINNLWPLDSEYGSLCASRKIMVSNAQSWGSWSSGMYSQFYLNSTGHFFHANGDGGDNNFHVIIYSRISNAYPLVAGSDGSQFGFMLSITPNVSPMNTYSTQPVAINTPPPPESWGYLGTYFRTFFGIDPEIPIKVLGTFTGSREIVSIELTPNFDGYRNAFTTPGVDNFSVYPNDTPNHSELQFNMFGSLFPQNQSTSTIEVTGRGDTQVSGVDGDSFYVISYFRFANPGTPTCNVTFNFNTGLYRFLGQYGWAGLHPLADVTIDLVAATGLQPLV